MASWCSRYGLILSDPRARESIEGHILKHCFAVLEEAPLRAQVPDDRPQAEGCHSGHQPGEASHVQEAEDRLQVIHCLMLHVPDIIIMHHDHNINFHVQGLRRSAEPQGRAGEDRESFPH